MDKSIERNKKFKIKYTKNDGEEVRRFGIVNDDCRGLGNRQKDNRPFLHYYDLDKKGYRYATNWEILIMFKLDPKIAYEGNATTELIANVVKELGQNV